MGKVINMILLFMQQPVESLIGWIKRSRTSVAITLLAKEMLYASLEDSKAAIR